MRLNLGAGLNKLNGYINIDKSKKAELDLVLDLDYEVFPYENNSVEEIRATHILEHIKNIIPLMNECYRVLKVGGKMHISVPQGIGIWADPTHLRAFSKISFRYYCGYPLSEIYGITAKFREESNIFVSNDDGGVLEVVLVK